MNAAERRIAKAEDEAFERSTRAILYGERPPKPPTELQLLERRVAELEMRLKVIGDMFLGQHECEETDW